MEMGKVRGNEGKWEKKVSFFLCLFVSFVLVYALALCTTWSVISIKSYMPHNLKFFPSLFPRVHN